MDRIAHVLGAGAVVLQPAKLFGVAALEPESATPLLAATEFLTSR
ncbi:hypothetical protein [Actinoplanes flavus]|nr:hypothetical protein [Actinoplanes flavus]